MICLNLLSSGRDRDRRTAYQRSHYRKNLIANRAKRTESQRQRRARMTPDQLREEGRRFYLNNPEACRAAQSRRRKENPAKFAATLRRCVLKKKYGLSIEQWDAMLASQGGVCAVCFGPPLGAGQYHVDHCHETGRVRGLLCHHCNVGLGNFRDRADLLEAALAYLKKGLNNGK